MDTKKAHTQGTGTVLTTGTLDSNFGGSSLHSWRCLRLGAGAISFVLLHGCNSLKCSTGFCATFSFKFLLKNVVEAFLLY